MRYTAKRFFPLSKTKTRFLLFFSCWLSRRPRNARRATARSSKRVSADDEQRGSPYATRHLAFFVDQLQERRTNHKGVSSFFIIGMDRDDKMRNERVAVEGFKSDLNALVKKLNEKGYASGESFRFDLIETGNKTAELKLFYDGSSSKRLIKELEDIMFSLKEDLGKSYPLSKLSDLKEKVKDECFV